MGAFPGPMRSLRELNELDKQKTLSCDLHIILQGIKGVPPLMRKGEGDANQAELAALNPATWVLDISTPAAEDRIGVDFADIFAKSEQAR